MKVQLIIWALLLSLESQAQSGGSATDTLPAPFATKSVKHFSKVIGWKAGQVPSAPEGFIVTLYADGLENPRWTYVTPNGDVLVAESNTIKNTLMQVGAVVLGAAKAENMQKSANRISILRDTSGDGHPDIREVFLQDLNQPFGMLIINKQLYVANTDGLLRFPYQPGLMKMEAAGEKILDLPAEAPNQHWTRNIITNADSSKIYIAVGSADNMGNKGKDVNPRRACILEINPDGSGERVYASGLRNPVGMDWAPGTQTLWVTVNERDGLGDNLVPDYLTGVQEGGFYGWPYSYFGQHEDPRIEAPRPDLVAKAIVPDVPLKSHSASLGLAFYTHTAFPSKYRGGAFIAQHGSWNRSELAGYKVVFVPFKNGKPAGPPEDFLTGFRPAQQGGNEVYGRPVGVTVLPDGSMLVTDDVNNRIWRVVAVK
ncbi:PQQ-dependent sugar dehydrogenase [Chitinophaga japonensis]|uniref:Glucose/arabinose dehydrogenase n=1 Tax=Chitinophaga japonensis TaxID=104662 RepID=A0A562T675_CHIJA|nr:sorbosone dehydrogenase family protein [Chitinophaga japonensis]TWI89025.1 glucose/arabinose dehydrogenase [Chitinophaga japonensis]